MSDAAVGLAPVTGKARIDVIDILRGLAILGIFFMNIPFMASRISLVIGDFKVIGWSPLDQAAWYAIEIFLSGTQRGLLEMLFGAGMMVLAARAMRPDGPVAVADLYLRRNLWLIGFGLIDVFVLLWTGDILHIYGLAALLLFPFRKLGPRLLLGLGLIFALVMTIGGGINYAERVSLVHTVEAAQAKQAAGAALGDADKKALADWQKRVAQVRTGPPELAKLPEMEKNSRSGFLGYAGFQIMGYLQFMAPMLLLSVGEAFCAMLIGIALWKWGVVQGERGSRFYLILMLACYVPGFALRALGAWEHTWMTPHPKTFWFTQEFTRLAVSVGHIAAVNLAMKFATGRAVFAPFKAAGRTAFSLYFLQQIIGIWILYAPWGLGLWGRQSWADMAGTALIVIAAELALANLWVRAFANGPMEWAWRSLAYCRWQPFRRRLAAPVPMTLEPA